eukprot:gene9388-6607_t
MGNQPKQDCERGERKQRGPLLPPLAPFKHPFVHVRKRTSVHCFSLAFPFWKTSVNNNNNNNYYYYSFFLFSFFCFNLKFSCRMDSLTLFSHTLIQHSYHDNHPKHYLPSVDNYLAGAGGADLVHGVSDAAYSLVVPIAVSMKRETFLVFIIVSSSLVGLDFGLSIHIFFFPLLFFCFVVHFSSSCPTRCMPKMKTKHPNKQTKKERKKKYEKKRKNEEKERGCYDRPSCHSLQPSSILSSSPIWSPTTLPYSVNYSAIQRRSQPPCSQSSLFVFSTTISIHTKQQQQQTKNNNEKKKQKKRPTALGRLLDNSPTGSPTPLFLPLSLPATLQLSWHVSPTRRRATTYRVLIRVIATSTTQTPSFLLFPSLPPFPLRSQTNLLPAVTIRATAQPCEPLLSRVSLFVFVSCFVFCYFVFVFLFVFCFVLPVFFPIHRPHTPCLPSTPEPIGTPCGPPCPVRQTAPSPAMSLDGANPLVGYRTLPENANSADLSDTEKEIMMEDAVRMDDDHLLHADGELDQTDGAVLHFFNGPLLPLWEIDIAYETFWMPYTVCFFHSSLVLSFTYFSNTFSALEDVTLPTVQSDPKLCRIVGPRHCSLWSQLQSSSFHSDYSFPRNLTSVSLEEYHVTSGDIEGPAKDVLYDAANPHADVRTPSHHGDEPSGDDPPENMSCFQSVVYKLSNLVPTGSLPATVFSTAATAMGGGILGLPSAFQLSGAVAGFIWIVAIGIETAYSLRLLALTSVLTGERSYERMASVLLGKGGTYFVSVMRFLNCFGSMIAYVMSIGDLLRPILEGADAPSFWLDDTGFHLLQSLLWLSDDMDLFVGGNNALEGIGVFMFSYICQVNQVELFREMKKPTVARFTLSASPLLLPSSHEEEEETAARRGEASKKIFFFGILVVGFIVFVFGFVVVEPLSPHPPPPTCVLPEPVLLLVRGGSSVLTRLPLHMSGTTTTLIWCTVYTAFFVCFCADWSSCSLKYYYYSSTNITLLCVLYQRSSGSVLWDTLPVGRNPPYTFLFGSLSLSLSPNDGKQRIRPPLPCQRLRFFKGDGGGQ